MCLASIWHHPNHISIDSKSTQIHGRSVVLESGGNGKRSIPVKQMSLRRRLAVCQAEQRGPEGVACPGRIYGSRRIFSHTYKAAEGRVRHQEPGTYRRQPLGRKRETVVPGVRSVPPFMAATHHGCQTPHAIRLDLPCIYLRVMLSNV